MRVGYSPRPSNNSSSRLMAPRGSMLSEPRIVRRPPCVRASRTATASKVSAHAPAKAIRYLIAGRVQGVNYRASTVARARELGLHGWAKNLGDGRVEVVARGAPAALDELARWLWQGPPAARVDAVLVEEWAERVDSGFGIVR